MKFATSDLILNYEHYDLNMKLETLMIKYEIITQNFGGAQL